MAICVMDDVLEHSPAGGAKYAPQVRCGSALLFTGLCAAISLRCALLVLVGAPLSLGWACNWAGWYCSGAPGSTEGLQ